ncbi:PaaI family thioesterase [Halegenticoccus tardaugens]|uniref:PaaI family thioesterase n=1 Tax=Halegenticoccus tardaugens TaxID=2071624 RepID=UPI00100B2CA1|nr:PaaI family thioesterase [Halegenticoccus tardaugens]
MNEPLTDEHVAGLESFVARHGFLSWLDLAVESIERGRVRLSVAYDEKLANPGSEVRSIHGGIAATLVDTASGFALRTAFEDPAAARLTTTDLDVSYLRPATADLSVEAAVVRAGRSVGVADVTVESETPDGERAQVAVGRATYRLFRDR